MYILYLSDLWLIFFLFFRLCCLSQMSPSYLSKRQFPHRLLLALTPGQCSHWGGGHPAKGTRKVCFWARYALLLLRRRCDTPGSQWPGLHLPMRWENLKWLHRCDSFGQLWRICRVQLFFLCITRGCASFIGMAIFVQTSLHILILVSVPRGSLFWTGISSCCWNHLWLDGW